MEITPGIHQIKVPLQNNPLGYVNAYLIQGTDGWTLVDTGWNAEESFSAFESQVKNIGLNFKDIKLIIITHIHPDHFGLAGRIKQLSGAELALHRIEQAFIDSRYLWTDLLLQDMGNWLRNNGAPESDLPNLQGASMGMLKLVALSIPDRALFGGETISTGIFDLRVLWTPGHSPGHVCLYEPEKKILFAGDHVLPVTTPNISLHVQSGDNPLRDYIESLKSLQNLDVELVLPAHEHTFTNLRERIKEILAHHDARAAVIVAAIEDVPKTAYQISAEIPWVEGLVKWDDLGALDKRVAMTETLAHLEALRIENKVEKVEKEQSIFYKAA
ncbi:MAG: MBL fold metallo-hydrolase [Chloroflexota bacterium]|nr:MBL fold metallo-hydrolase [Chloroflexota bacterium]